MEEGSRRYNSTKSERDGPSRPKLAIAHLASLPQPRRYPFRDKLNADKAAVRPDNFAISSDAAIFGQQENEAATQLGARIRDSKARTAI
jgi:hypothetical protein